MHLPGSPVHQFVGCYLHQDWPEFYGTWQGAVDEFVREEPDDARDFGADAAGLLAKHKTSAELGQILVVYGCDYWPSEYDGDYLRWFREVAAYVAEAVGQTHR